MLRLQLTARRLPTLHRSLHSTPIAFKKKGKASAQAESIWEDEPSADDDLFGGAAPTKSAQAVVPPPVQPQTSQSASRKLTSRRLASFEEERASILSKVAPESGPKTPVRKTCVRNLLRWVDNGAQLEVVADVIESVRRSKTTLADETAKEFLGRCISLNRPDIALKVLTQRYKYGLDLPDIQTARDILHSIFLRATQPKLLSKTTDASAPTPFSKSHQEDALLLAALYPYFRLGQASEDPVTSALLISLFIEVKDLENAKSLAVDVQAAVKKGTLAKKVDSHRQQVWLTTELQKKQVKKSLSEWGLSPESLSSISAP